MEHLIFNLGLFAMPTDAPSRLWIVRHVQLQVQTIAPYSKGVRSILSSRRDELSTRFGDTKLVRCVWRNRYSLPTATWLSQTMSRLVQSAHLLSNDGATIVCRLPKIVSTMPSTTQDYVPYILSEITQFIKRHVSEANYSKYSDIYSMNLYCIIF